MKPHRWAVNGAALAVAVCLLLVLSSLAAGSRRAGAQRVGSADRVPNGATVDPLATAADQSTPTETLPPTEVPPTPEEPPGTPEPLDRCLTGVPGPRLFWTLYVAPWVDGATGMWVPFRDNGGPYLKAYVKARYGGVWYGATLDPAEGRLTPDPLPAWPRPDIIRLASSGVQTSRGGNPMCGRSADAASPPCYAELVVPLVFLDRLAQDGPYLRHTYFWAPSNQVAIEPDGPSRVTARQYDAAACDTSRIGPRLGSARPVYTSFGGCAAPSRRVDTCYLVGCGDLWEHCR